MKRKAEIILLKAAYTIMLLALFILPSLFTKDLSVIRNPLINHGEHSLTCSLILNSTFLLLATGSLIAGWKYYEGLVFHRIILLLFCLFLIITAISGLVTFIDSLRNFIGLGQLQFYFITNVWLTFIILVFSTYTLSDTRKERDLTILTGISAALMLIFISESDNSAGLWERILLLISFGWIIHTFNNGRFKCLNIKP